MNLDWQDVFRIACTLKDKDGKYVLPTKGLEALAVALETDDFRLLQMATTSPPPLMCVQDWPVEAADAIAFACWQGSDLITVLEVEEAFADVCFRIDQEMGEPAACRYFLNTWDETPRAEMRCLLLPVLRRAIEEREAEPAERIAS